MLEEYELLSARNIIHKKEKQQDIDEILMYLRKKKYNNNTISKIKSEITE
jgi:hypothetical protein